MPWENGVYRLQTSDEQKALPALTGEEVFKLARSIWDPQNAKLMVGIAAAESQFRPDIEGDEGGSIGIWQVNRRWMEELHKAGIITVPDEQLQQINTLMEGKTGKWYDEIPERIHKDIWHEHIAPQMKDPITNVHAAGFVSLRRGWNKQQNRWDTRGHEEGKTNKSALYEMPNLAEWSTWDTEDTHAQPPTGKLIEARDRWPENSPYFGMSATEVSDQIWENWMSTDTNAMYPEEVGGFGEPGSEASTTSYFDMAPQDILELEARTGRKIWNFINSNPSNIRPVFGKVTKDGFTKMKRDLQATDPELADALGDVHSSPLVNGKAAVVSYSPGFSPNNLTKFGLEADPKFPWYVKEIGADKKDFSKMDDTQKEYELFNLAIGMLSNPKEEGYV